MSEDTWPQKGNIYELGFLRDMPRLAIRHRAPLLYLNRHALKLLGDPSNIEASINPALRQIRVAARGQYVLSGQTNRLGRAATFPDSKFMPKGVYAPVPGDEHLYQHIGDFASGLLQRGPRGQETTVTGKQIRRRRKNDGV